jgi:hypothetical protein
MPEAIDVIREARAQSRTKAPIRSVGWLLILAGVAVIVGGVVAVIVAHLGPAAAVGVFGALLIKTGMGMRAGPAGQTRA